jgi:hypothetical protein
MDDGQTGFLGIIFNLMDRGLTGQEIDRAMKQVVGPDWKEVHVAIWLARLKEKQFIKEVNEDTCADELEALILGKIRLDEISRGV